mmetsp:Transcript_18170/g.30369  ORF Transcript_18170/g.30369 Transcript_18170/m.30369 type:complete len:479 (+) Transcript_18170:173-1609(+)|eukprot:CAMPEP_0119315638 /NCGR_PEP_ID=MMETSP1333-20130426/36670_1 /TAXON_ID=418940 /ORGANISM="Scyphosphaera apsteinii, Strain RCC1455" /LENGTH=478 /DNA_ID=CAMNT_0007321069 /DNA_START=169 /DNA_END=1605 /DNA_ORIENTATION=-
MADFDDRGLGIVRIKPLGAGGGGVERRGSTAWLGELPSQSRKPDESSSLKAASVIQHGGSGVSPKPSEMLSGVRFTSNSVTLMGGKTFTFPKIVVPPEDDNEALFNEFMPRMIDGFFGGYNVNICAYGQTGTGKTHTMFGPPGILADAAKGSSGLAVRQGYGLFPRAVIAIFATVETMRQSNPGKNFALCGAAVEMLAEGNVDMFGKSASQDPRFSKADVGIWSGMGNGVGVDRTVKPAVMYGQSEHVMETEKDLLKMFGALSVRNTAGTAMNDSSSRSHCFAWLTLHVHDKAADTIQKTRFQFCDLAGSERMKEAHGESNYKAAGMEAINGLVTNWSLMMLGQCVRDIVELRKKNKKVTEHSLRTYLGDLVPLLSESLTSEAITAVFICVSQNPANNSQSLHSLHFGSQFSELRIQRKQTKAVKRLDILKFHEKRFAENENKMQVKPRMDRFSVMRIAQNNESKFHIELYSKFSGAG